MAPLAPCPDCERHVRITESRCPFCDADVRGAMAGFSPPRVPTERLSRAALAAFAAGTLGAAGCNSPKAAPEPVASSGVPSVEAVAVTAAPAPSPTTDSTGAPAAPTSSAVGTRPVPVPGATGTEQRVNPLDVLATALPAASALQPSEVAMVRPGMAAYGAPPPHLDLGNTSAAYGAPPSGAVEGPKGMVTLGSAAVTGGPVANAARVVAGMRAGFRNCYNRGLAADPTLAGQGTLTVGVGPSGEVTNAKLAPTTPSPSVSTCVESRARAAQFDPPGSGTATITVPLTFTIQN